MFLMITFISTHSLVSGQTVVQMTEKKEEGEEVGKEAKEEECEGNTVDGYLVMEGQFPGGKEDNEGAY